MGEVVPCEHEVEDKGSIVGGASMGKPLAVAVAFLFFFPVVVCSALDFFFCEAPDVVRPL